MNAPRDAPAAVRWRRLESLLEQAFELPADEQGPFLDRACGDDTAARAELARLLAADRDAPAFLNGGAAELLGEELGGLAPEPPASRLGTQLGRYRLLEEIGRGGSSRVYLAEPVDDRLGRRVAVKVLTAIGERDEMARRFAAEGRVLAALSHPHIAQVYDAGLDPDGDPYLVMEWIEGEPITEHCACAGLSLDARLALVLEVCAAVAHAHRRLVVHRDLKPSNILVDRQGHVKLLDFGIAKLLDADPALAPRTRTGLLPMTPEYAAPEQVRGDDITTATDVYALAHV